MSGIVIRTDNRDRTPHVAKTVSNDKRLLTRVIGKILGPGLGVLRTRIGATESLTCPRALRRRVAEG